MSAPAFAWALEQGQLLGLSPLERLVLLYLADKANGERVAWPGQPLIEKFTGVSQKWLRHILPRLAAAGLIRIEATPGKVTRYHILRPLNGTDNTPEPSSRVPGNPVPGVIPATPEPSSAPPRNYAAMTPEPSSLTPEPSSAEPSISKKEEPKRRAGAPEAKTSDSGEVGKEAQPPDPPVDPGAFQALIRDIASGFKNNYPPRVSGFSRNEQIEATEDKPTIKPLPLAGAVLAAARAAAGVRVPA